jgi:hypothetical protein
MDAVSPFFSKRRRSRQFGSNMYQPVYKRVTEWKTVFDFRQGEEMFLSLTASRLALGST